MKIAGQLLLGWGLPNTAPVLAIADREDGTGADATLSGVATGNSVEVWTVKVDADFNSLAATLGGSRTGNGALELELTPGPYWAFARQAGSPVSNLVYFFVTTGDESVQQRILDSVQARLRNLLLENLDSERIVIRAEPWSRNLPKPCCVISPAPEQLDPAAATNLRDQIGYGVVVAFARATHEELEGSRNELYEWRRRAMAAFRNQTLAGVPEVFRCVIEPEPVIDPSAFEHGLDVSSFTIRCLTYESR